jgi:ribonuclease BN (tRNA processing enzyme)
MSALHVLGSSPAVPRPNRANSGYLVRGPDVALVLELGAGALSRLLAIAQTSEIDAVLISHMHADHFFDLVPLRYALKYESPRAQQLPVFLPPGATRSLRSVVAPFAPRGGFFNGLFDLSEYEPDAPLRVRSATVTFAKTRHYINGYAMRVDLPDGVIVFSSDTAPAEAVVDLARDADLFLCECGLGVSGEERGRRGHSNAKEAGAMAQAAGVKHLVLTHYGMFARPGDLRRAAESAFSGSVTVADDGMEIPFAPSTWA